MRDCTTLLFDLDGTLSDPSAGITASIGHALERMGAAVPPLASLKRFIGPPLRHSFAELLTPEQVETAIVHYRERYDAGGGMFDNVLFPAMPALLAELTQQGKKLFVATSKPHIMAQKIINHFQLDQYFIKIYGPELDGIRNDKAELLAYLCSEEKIAPDTAVMIGDRKHDIIAANKNSMRSIGVLWGFGDAAELQAAGATTIIQTPLELRALLLNERFSSSAAAL